MKATLFFAFIVSVIPVFLLLTYVFSTRHRLAELRERCRATDEPARAGAEYEAARRAFPANVIAWLFGFRPMNVPSRESSSPSR